MCIDINSSSSSSNSSSDRTFGARNESEEVADTESSQESEKNGQPGRCQHSWMKECM